MNKMYISTIMNLALDKIKAFANTEAHLKKAGVLLHLDEGKGVPITTQVHYYSNQQQFADVFTKYGKQPTVEDCKGVSGDITCMVFGMIVDAVEDKELITELDNLGVVYLRPEIIE